MQDNAPIHKAKMVMEWFENNRVMLTDWLSYSPDLNPIEHLWYKLKRLIYQVRPEIDSVTGSDDTVREALWKALDLGRYKNSEEVNRGHGKKDKSSYNCGGMAYKVLKIDYGAKNVANYVCNHGTKFESFAVIISWLALDRIRGVKCWWGLSQK